MKMKRKCASVLFVNNQQEVLLMLRDDIPSIPFPNCWTLPGGHAEIGETVEQCAVREIQEEIELQLQEFEFFKVVKYQEEAIYIFWEKANFEIADINLHEGQAIQWFSEQEISELEAEKFAFHFKILLLDFFKVKPFVKDAKV
ncbi:MAG: NUDIX domain-containing protein [Candidatus Moraniibacteriota bacterium]